jgi:hypothetical protein
MPLALALRQSISAPLAQAGDGGRAMRTSLKILALMAAPLSGIASAEAEILMPAGSTVWMKFESNVCPFANGNDCLGSNQSGPNPPNGIPLTTFGSSPGATITGSAEILPDRFRTFMSGSGSGFMHASFEDTYTVHGVAPGIFDIPVELHMTGTARTVNTGAPPGLSPHRLWVANVDAEIGTFNPSSAPLFQEGFRVTGFDTISGVRLEIPDIFSEVPGSRPIDITASHIVTNLVVGSTFTLAFGFNSRFATGEIDLLSTGAISFELPPGVFLTSALGGRFGAETPSEVPLPAALPLFAGGLGLMAFLARRRTQKAHAA